MDPFGRWYVGFAAFAQLPALILWGHAPKPFRDLYYRQRHPSAVIINLRWSPPWFYIKDRSQDEYGASW